MAQAMAAMASQSWIVTQADKTHVVGVRSSNRNSPHNPQQQTVRLINWLNWSLSVWKRMVLGNLDGAKCCQHCTDYPFFAALFFFARGRDSNLHTPGSAIVILASFRRKRRSSGRKSCATAGRICFPHLMTQSPQVCHDHDISRLKLLVEVVSEWWDQLAQEHGGGTWAFTFATDAETAFWKRFSMSAGKLCCFIVWMPHVVWDLQMKLHCSEA